MKKIIVFGILFLCVLGCKNKNTEEETAQLQEDYGTIYFVRYMVNTEMAVSCNNFMDSLGSLSSYFKIEDENFIDELLYGTEVDEMVGVNYGMDVRYRIELEDKIICIDDFGYYSINNKYSGKLSNFQLLLDYVEKHREHSIKLEEDFPFVD
ncbi:hypothetical protein M2306_000894 [Myroides gitamensis]|uniref:hypothetical protein n=1 Tax=Myroides odoratus TaxID=256 RepID=UPI0021687E2B|nr:hypothetical protein [Myroides odoratus]MCS4238123.1 hypothetical protein [Myroides odoratus]MDH6600200.1 hypothetical protein [Myroides gitamensis]